MTFKRLVPLAVLSILVWPAPGRSQKPEYSSTFERVWTAVNENFFDPAFGGLDWQDVHDRYRPQIAAAQTDAEFYSLVNTMLWELKVSHTNIVPPGSFGLYEPLVFAEGSPGLDVRLLQGAAVVTSVRPGSPAHEAGFRPGFVIQALDGLSVEEIVHQAEAWQSPPYNGPGRVAKITKRILARIHGAPGTELSITYLDEGGKRNEQKIGRVRRTGATVGPHLFLALEFQARRLDGGIGYVCVNTLQPQFAAQVSKAIQALGNIRGLVLDLRGNSGGEIEGLPELFLTERTLFYLARSRKGETRVFFEPAAGAFKGPLVLLIDPLSGSASELLAACLQEIGRAVVVGERSPGSVMEMDREIFPNGAILTYAVARMVTPKGTILEGRGVVPDIEVRLDRDLLLEGLDSQLDAAIRHIEKATSGWRRT